MNGDFILDESKEEVRLKRLLAKVAADYAEVVEENMKLRGEIERLNKFIGNTSRKERVYVPQIN
jgi:cell division septum initiation protein DivIVA